MIPDSYHAKIIVFFISGAVGLIHLFNTGVRHERMSSNLLNSFWKFTGRSSTAYAFLERISELTGKETTERRLTIFKEKFSILSDF